MEQCIEIVDTYGMKNVGVYRVPGNSVVINALTESFNRGDFSQSERPASIRNDVNAISSVMKSFFRKFITGSASDVGTSGAVIEASKMEPEEMRLNSIKKISGRTTRSALFNFTLSRWPPCACGRQK